MVPSWPPPLFPTFPVNPFFLHQAELFSIACNQEPSETNCFTTLEERQPLCGASLHENRKGRIYGFVQRGPFQPGTKYIRKSDDSESKSLPQANISERKRRWGAGGEGGKHCRIYDWNLEKPHLMPAQASTLMHSLFDKGANHICNFRDSGIPKDLSCLRCPQTKSFKR